MSGRREIMVVVTTPGPYFGLTSSTRNVFAITRSTYDDVSAELDRRWGKGEKVGAIGATLGRWCISFTNGAGVRRQGGTQTMMLFSTFTKLHDSFYHGSSVKNKVITQMAARDGQILVLYEPMLTGERAHLQSHVGRLTAQVYKSLENEGYGLLAAEYFEPEDRWIFVTSSINGVYSERWAVRSGHDSSYIREGYDEGYCIRTIVSSPTQRLIFMQKYTYLKEAGQNYRIISDISDGWIKSQWDNGKVITCLAGVPSSSASSSGVVSTRRPSSGSDDFEFLFQRTEAACKVS